MEQKTSNYVFNSAYFREALMEQYIFNYFDSAHYEWLMSVYSDASMGAKTPSQFANFIERCLIGNNFIPEQAYRNMRDAIDTNSAVYKKSIVMQYWGTQTEIIDISKQFNSILYAINQIHPEIKLFRVDV